jgi:hypothetical protein
MILSTLFHRTHQHTESRLRKYTTWQLLRYETVTMHLSITHSLLFASVVCRFLLYGLPHVPESGAALSWVMRCVTLLEKGSVPRVNATPSLERQCLSRASM